MITEIWGTVEQLTAETNCAPYLMIPDLSALRPTIKPVTLWRKRIGVFLNFMNHFQLPDKVDTYCWLQLRMNCAPFAASSELMTGV